MEPASPATVLVGRDDELAALTGRLEAVRAGQAGTVLIGGDAGIGKTRLVTELTRDVPDRVLWGGCLPIGQRGVPYLALIDLLRGLSSEERRRVPPALQTLTSPGEVAGAAVSRSQLFQAVLDLFERLASRQPLVVVIEDLHWADTSLLDLVDFLTGLLRDEPILLLTTFRNDGLSAEHALGEALIEWERRPSVTRLDLAPLSTEDALRVVVERLGEDSAGLSEARQLAERAGGNPFFLEQLAAAYGSGERIPRRLHDLLLSRTQALPAEALRVLRIASVGGVSIDEELLGRVASLRVDDIRHALRTSMAMQLLTLDADGCRFRHALLAEALHTDLLPAERRAYHAAYAMALLERGDAPPARVAVHHAEAGQAAEALTAWVGAAKQAERLFAFAEARHALEAALQLWGRVDAPEQLTGADSIDLRRRLAEATFHTGDPEGACRLAQSLLAELDPSEDPLTTAMVHFGLARYLCNTPRYAEALAEQERAVALVPPSPPSKELAEVISGLAALLRHAGRSAEARVRAQEAIALAQVTGAVHAEVSARNTLGTVLFQLDDFEAGRATMREAFALAERIHDGPEQARSLWNLSASLWSAARWQEIVDDAAGTIAVFRRLRPTWVVEHMVSVAEALFKLGRWAEAETMIEAARREDPTRAVTGLPDLHVARGELVQARAILDARRKETFASDVELHLWVLVDDADVELAAGRLGLALEIIDDVVTQSMDLHTPNLLGPAIATGLWAAADLASGRARTTADQRATACALGRRYHERIQALLDEPGPPDGWKREAAAFLSHSDAELSRLEGRHQPDLWQSAVDRWDALAMPYRAAYCRFRWAEAELGYGGDRDRVAQPLSEVLSRLEQLREVRIATEIRRLARRARLDVGDAEDGPGAAFGLTNREHEVLRHMAAGASNRQIAEALYISQKTVSVHVSSILRKMQAASRGEATATAISEGLVAVTELGSRA